MRIALTGTPGTGKTTVSRQLETDLTIIPLHDVIEDEELFTGVDEERESLIVDLAAVKRHLDGVSDVIIESHLAHHVDVDRVIVLRCRPDELERRLRERGASRAKQRENADAEALDLILSEAVSLHGSETVYEIDTTDRPIENVVDDVESVLAGDRKPSVGTVSFMEYLSNDA